MCYVTTTILIWCIILWSLDLAHVQFLLACISRPVTIPGTYSKLFASGLFEAPCDFHGSHQILHFSYLSSNQLLLINLSHRLSFCLLSCNCLFSLTLWWAAEICSTQFERQIWKISVYQWGPLLVTLFTHWWEFSIPFWIRRTPPSKI